MATTPADPVATAGRAYRRAAALAEQRREALHHAITDALAAGRSQSDVAKASGYTREHIHRLSRNHG